MKRDDKNTINRLLLLCIAFKIYIVRALLKQSTLEVKHYLSGKLFHICVLLFTINECSGASTLTRGVLTFNLCALEVLVLV